MEWTKEQQKAIELRGANLLVSAAAGSGKTAVLVERIVKMVCEDDYEIDRILVVTFTKAAAAEMRERVGKRLMEEAAAHPDNQKLQRQLAYIHRAPISTIHSFCMDLLRNHFHLISLDPGFRIGEEGEIALLKEQVLEEMMEECYAQKEPDFLAFVEAYSYGRDDTAIGKMILQLYQFSRSHPDPDAWLEHARNSTRIKKGENPDWLIQMMRYADRVLADSISLVKKAEEMAKSEPFIKEKYGSVLEKDREKIEAIFHAKTYEERVEQFKNLKFDRIPAIRKTSNPFPELTDAIKGIRDEAKKMVTGLGGDSFYASMEEIERESKMLFPYVNTLVGLVRRFGEKYRGCKMEKNILEFDDLEHFAISLLVKKYDEKAVEKTALAEELSAFYQAVFTDEYQDSNLIQEVILQAVSREDEGNRFMVGDIKQSIYKFRMARPELFLEKYESYQEEGKNQKIELKNNFRSKKEVLFSVNYFFYQFMKSSLGGVSYEQKVALTPPEKKEGTLDLDEENPPIPQEILLLNMAETNEEGRRSSKLYFDRETGEEYRTIELEARMVARRIKEMPEREYKDMVILLRTVEGWAQVFEEVLSLNGIPVHMESRTGYFDTFEIRVLLNLLSVVDNIYQDIPLAAVLRSPIGGLNGEELAMIRSTALKEQRLEDSLYDEMVFYLEKEEQTALSEKIIKVLKLFDELREEKTRLSLEELIWSALEKTGYYHFVGSMPNGRQRMANVRMLLEKARQYESTSFKGVFHFLRYIEQLKSYQVDYGEASVLGEEANVVRIMSIHKSKGLEFPIVFLCGIGKQFNFMDRNQRMVLHPDYYLGLDCIDLERRTKKASNQKKMIRKELELSMLGEEIRVLYVAMTRAKEKLIMTGTIADFDKKLRETCAILEEDIRFVMLAGAKSYLDWIFLALCRHPVMDPWKKSRNIETENTKYFTMEGEKPCFSFKVTAPFVLLAEEMEKQYVENRERKDFVHWALNQTNEEKDNPILQAFAWKYPKEKELAARSKWSVSQLKEEKMEPLFVPAEEEDEPIKNESDGQFIVENGLKPAFLHDKERKLTGAGRGTIVHKLMEKISFSQAAANGFLNAISIVKEKDETLKDEMKSLPLKQLERFFTSELSVRLAKAENEGNLYREAQFMMGVPMKDMEPETESDEFVLVQGIIDLYMEEDGELVLLDYKTDRVGKEGEQELIRRYKNQLYWYKRALEQMTKKRVKETLIYSFTLSKAIEIDFFE
ncbi:MAG: helicase-exonuclease AddAB subunit AddA [Lachnospiraceae bacterium]|nr:helicase-exonuclease AddAB subunit AddA [Lachnospiraceae bacterium]